MEHIVQCYLFLFLVLILQAPWQRRKAGGASGDVAGPSTSKQGHHGQQGNENVNGLHECFRKSLNYSIISSE